MLTQSEPRERDCPGSLTVVQAAHDRLRRLLHLATRPVSCEYTQGVLWLRGRLPTYYQKQMAQEAVRGLDGVRQVVNDIQVVQDVLSSPEAKT
jgi:osmotically-inducible protein OsmY